VYLETSAVWVSRSPLRDVTQEADLKQPATSVLQSSLYLHKNQHVWYYMKMHVSEWYLHAACYGKCRIAFVMLITVLVLLEISSCEVFQGTAGKRVVRCVKKCCFPSLSFPVNRLSSCSNVGLCNFLIIPTALQVGDLVRIHDLRCVSLSLLCRFTNPLKHFCFASDRPAYSYRIAVCICTIIHMSPENEILSS